MATSIGTAWIQIKPSLKGVSNDVKKALGDAGDGASNNFGSKFKSSFLASSKAAFGEAFSEFGKRSDEAFSKFKSLAAGAMVGLGGIATYAVKQFAEYEQLVGGVETLFKKNSGEVVQYAKNAYKTAQLSANQYMDTVTSFSASLLQGLKGDTAKAAKISDMAITDMADNANKMGTSMESIQYAYQGFAKNNYTMLDNLKLGYGGTASEMARLINDSGVMGKTFKATAKNVSSIPFDKVIEAIHSIQTKLDITGTSAKEASSTISGSFNAAKAAFDNMLTSLADPNGNFEESFNIFLASAKQFLQNLAPVIKSMLKTVFEEIKKQSPELAQGLKDAVDTIRKLFDFAKNNPELIANIVKLAVGFKALQIATGGARSALDTLKPWAKLGKGIFTGVIGGAQTLIGKFKDLKAAKGSVDAVTKTMEGAGSAVGASADTVAGGVDKLSSAVKKSPKEFTFGKSMANFFKEMGTLTGGAVQGAWKPVTEFFKGAGETVAGFFKALASPDVLVGVLSFTAAAAGVAAAILLIGGALGIVSPGLRDFLNMVVIPLAAFLVGTFLVVLAAVTTTIIRLTNEAVIPLTNAVAGGLTSVFNSIGGVIESAGNAISRVVDSISNGISKIINSIANLISSVGGQDWYGTGYGITRNFTAGLLDGMIDLLQDSLNKVINNIINIPGIGNALKAVGVKANPVNLSGFKLGKRAKGGPVFGPGGPTSDSIPMLLSNGEYVIKASSARKIGYDKLNDINSTGSAGNTLYQTININGYNRDPKELADEISKIIALQKGRVMG